MKNQDFKDFLFKSAVMTMACDGNISEREIEEIKSIVGNEIYFMGFESEAPLKNNIDNIKLKAQKQKIPSTIKAQYLSFSFSV